MRLMAPIEGFPFYFLCFWSAIPGYYQFKHVVLCEWSYEEGKLMVTGSHGNCSGCLLGRELKRGHLASK